jgi:hypothetical protein
MYVLSALCKLPFSVYSNKAIKKIAIYFAFAFELRRISARPFGEIRSTLESALAEQITRNNLLRPILWAVGGCARGARLIIRFVQRFTVGSTKTTVKFHLHDRNQCETIDAASEKIASIYKAKIQPHLKP